MGIRGPIVIKVEKRHQKHINLIKELESYINNKVGRNGNVTFSYANIAIDFNVSFELIRDILYYLDCGNNGVRIVGPDYKEEY